MFSGEVILLVYLYIVEQMYFANVSPLKDIEDKVEKCN